MFDLDLKPYDILPLIPILKGAGVAIIDLSEEQNYSSIIACKSVPIVETITAIFRLMGLLSGALSRQCPFYSTSAQSLF